jgi:PAS domain S-box-containing protein
MAKATYLLRKAGELVKERKYQEAVEVYLQATETDSSDARAWFGLGVCLYKVDNLDVARIALERAQKMGYPRAEEALGRVEAAEKRRAADGTGAKATVAPAEARRRADSTPTVAAPPRPEVRPEEQKLDLDRFLRVMLIENLVGDRDAIARAIEGTIKSVEVKPADYGVSTSDTMSGTVRYDVAILDWDTAPDAAAGLIQILKIKRPGLFVICLTEKWDPETAVEILEAGADYHVVKEPHFASVIPLVLAQWAKRDTAVALLQEGQAGAGDQFAWPPAMNSLGEALMLVDADLTITQANPSAMKQFRMGEDEFVGASYPTILYGEEEPPETCPIVQVLEKGEPASDSISHRGLGTDLRVQAWPVRNPAGKVTSAIAVVREAEAGGAVDEDLKDREWLFRSLTEKANAGVGMVGPDGRVHYANQALCTFLDQTQEEVLDHAIETFVAVEDQENLREALAKAVEKGESAERISLERGDGRSVPAEVRMARFSAPEGTCLVVSVMGAAELEQTEQELWSETRKLSAVLDDGIDRLECGVVALDSGGNVMWANGLACDLLGARKEALIGKPYAQAAQQGLTAAVRDADGFLDALRGAHANGGGLKGHTLVLGDGEELAYWSSPVSGSAGGVSRIEHFYPSAPGAVQEVTLPEGDNTLAGIAAAVPEMLFTAGEDGCISWVNPAASAVSGYGEGDLSGKPLADLAAAEDRDKVRDLLAAARDIEQQVQKAEARMARSNGTSFWAEIALLSAGGQLHGCVRDVSDRKMAQAIKEIVTRGPGA